MFVGSPAWMGLLVLGTLGVAFAATPGTFIRADAGIALFAIILVMWFAPKIATVLDVLSRGEARRSFGGGVRFVASVVCETLFFIMLSPIMWFGHTLFLDRLDVRPRDRLDRAVARRSRRTVRGGGGAALAADVLGLASIGVLALTVPSAIPYALFIAGGLILAIPLAVVTASPAFGTLLVAARALDGCRRRSIRLRRCVS